MISQAFNATAGRLRKLWVMEKLTGNCLQKAMVEQVWSTLLLL